VCAAGYTGNLDAITMECTGTDGPKWTSTAAYGSGACTAKTCTDIDGSGTNHVCTNGNKYTAANDAQAASDENCCTETYDCSGGPSIPITDAAKIDVSACETKDNTEICYPVCAAGYTGNLDAITMECTGTDGPKWISTAAYGSGACTAVSGRRLLTTSTAIYEFVATFEVKDADLQAIGNGVNVTAAVETAIEALLKTANGDVAVDITPEVSAKDAAGVAVTIVAPTTVAPTVAPKDDDTVNLDSGAAILASSVVMFFASLFV